MYPELSDDDLLTMTGIFGSRNKQDVPRFITGVQITVSPIFDFGDNSLWVKNMQLEYKSNHIYENNTENTKLITLIKVIIHIPWSNWDVFAIMAPVGQCLGKQGNGRAAPSLCLQTSIYFPILFHLTFVATFSRKTVG